MPQKLGYNGCIRSFLCKQWWTSAFWMPMSSVASGMTTVSSDGGWLSTPWKCSVFLSSGSISLVNSFSYLTLLMYLPPFPLPRCSLWIHYILVWWSCELSLALPLLPPPQPQLQVGPWLLHLSRRAIFLTSIRAFL